MLQLTILTPERIVYKDDVNEAIVPTTTGQITILPGHIPIISQLSEGELVVKKGKSDTFIAITNGYIEVNNDKISILTDYAIRSEEVEIAKSLEAKKRAEKIMQEKISEEDIALAQATLTRALLELKVAERKRRHANLPPSSSQNT